jgi:hypothetical protein
MRRSSVGDPTRQESNHPLALGHAYVNFRHARFWAYMYEMA